MYAKIYEQIFDSSIAEDYQVRHVFEDLLKLADQEGVVNRTHEAIARRTNVPLEIVRRGIEALEKPDPRSQSKEADGRRLVRLEEGRDWGWRIVNHGYYRALRTAEEKRNADRNRQRNNRNGSSLPTRKLQKLQSVTSAYASVSASDPEGSAEGGNGNEVPTVAMCKEYASNPACAFPPELVEEWFNKSSDRGWGMDWRARMRGASATYRAIRDERRAKEVRSGSGPRPEKKHAI